MKLKLSILTVSLVFLVLSALSLYLFIDGDSRYSGFRLIAETQNLIFEKQLGRALGQKNFNSAITVLESRFKYLQDLSPGNNTLTPSYFQNLKKSFDAAITSQEKSLFINLLEQLRSLYSENYQVRIMLAHSYGEESPQEALQVVDEAIMLLGSAPESYRLGIKVAWKTKNLEKLQGYCSAYKVNQLGGKKFADMDANQMQELGLRRMGISINTEGKNFFIENNAMKLGEKLKYEFTFPEVISIKDRISLFLPTMHGISVDISEINFFSKGIKVHTELRNNFILSASESFFLNDGSLLLANYQKPEVIDFMFISKLDLFEIDKINLLITFNRQPMFSKKMCPQEK